MVLDLVRVWAAGYYGTCVLGDVKGEGLERKVGLCHCEEVIRDEMCYSEYVEVYYLSIK